MTEGVAVGGSRERILESATRLFASRGFSSTSLSQVAEGARVSKGLVLWHFESKGNLFRAALDHALDALAIDVLADLRGLSEIDQLGRLIDEYHRFVVAHLPSVKFFLALVAGVEQCPQGIVPRITQVQLSYRDLMAAVIEAAQERGLVRPEIHPPLRASLIMAALHGIHLQSLLQGQAPERTLALLAHLKRRVLEDCRARERVDGPEASGSRG